MILKYDNRGQPYEDLTAENKKLRDRVKELENSLTTALQINDKYQRENKELKEKYEASLKEIDRLSEENTNIKTMKDDGKNTSNDS